MAVVAAVKTGELLHQVARESEGEAGKGTRPGLQIVIIQKDGSHQIACGPLERSAPMIEATPINDGSISSE
jgi:hypothetical protein